MAMKKTDTFFLRHIGWTCAIAITLIVLSYFFFDVDIALLFHEIWPTESILLHLFNELSNPNPQVLFWPVIFFVVRYIYNNKTAGEKILTIMLSVCVSNAISIPMKMLLGRARPALLFSENVYSFDIFSAYTLHLSFPSGHAITIASVMGALACYYPRYSIHLLCLALIMGSARVMATAHYLSDVFAGVFLGILISQWVFSRIQKCS